MGTASIINEFLTSIAGRGLAAAGLINGDRNRSDAKGVIHVCHMLLSSRGEASGIALSERALSGYKRLGESEKTEFFQSLLAQFSADQDQAKTAARQYLSDPTINNLVALSETTEPVRRILLERLNQSPGATIALVNMRADLLERMRTHPELEIVDRDFVHLFTSWFNRGFLELRQIDWQTSAALLEKIIAYEAVHGMSGWDDLRERIDPPDRLVYGFFHPRLANEPLIFVEVALMESKPGSIDTILSPNRTAIQSEKSTTAVFYSISNCQRGLRGIPLGNFLIKQVVEDLRIRFPNLREYVTLSPVPSLRKWLTGADSVRGVHLPPNVQEVLQNMQQSEWGQDIPASRQAAKLVLPAAAHYLTTVKDSEGKPRDPVARFHLGNGARLERVNWAADMSSSGLQGAFGIMVNYLYKLDEIERNHERFANSGLVNASAGVHRQAKAFEGVPYDEAVPK